MRYSSPRRAIPQACRDRTQGLNHLGGGAVANYTVKKRRITCHHEEVLPPIAVMWIDREGRYRHGARSCSSELDYLGTGETRGSETEVRFWCRHCKENVSLPLAVLDRLVRLGKYAQERRRRAMRTDDSENGGNNYWDFDHLHPQGNGTRFPRTVSVGENPSGRSCRLCGMPHLRLPKVKQAL